MASMLSFVYCFDQNYKFQAETAIISLLENVDEKVNINIIYSESSLDLNNTITNHRYLNKLNISNFKPNRYTFPNLEGVHVSEATYYRFFISEYINDDCEYLIYLDTDIICVNNPLPFLKKEINNLKNSTYLIGASTEYKFDTQIEEFKRLSLSGDYFNAGVLIIKYAEWQKKQIGNSLLNHMENIKKTIRYWDQDVLNSFFNGDYLEISHLLNYSTSTQTDYKSEYKEIIEKVFFLHFSGKIKPWYIKGTDSKVAEVYHRNYRKLNYKNYHLTSRNRKLDTYDLLRIFLKLNILKLDKKLNFLIQSLKTIVRI